MNGGIEPQGPVPHDVKQAIDYIRENVGRRISLQDLVAHCGVPARTLHKHFRNFMGISPLGFWRRVRLAAARADLLNGASDASVTDVATRAGFSHLGRFAQQYQLAFGEPPSATLCRNRVIQPGRPDHNREPVPKPEDCPTLPSGIWSNRPSIAVLPCQFSSASPESRYFAEYLTEGLASSLCRTRSLSVIVPRSLQGVKAASPNRSADARYVLAGRVAQSRECVRVIIRLIDAKTELQIWGDIYDGDINELFALQDRVAEGVMQGILPQIRASEIERAQRKAAQDLDAYDLTMRAVSFVSASGADTAWQALDLLGRAMEIDPNYGPATALAAWCHAQLVLYNGSSSPGGEEAHALLLCDRAGILAPDDPLVLTARCAVHTMADDLDRANSLIDRALARDPTFVWGWDGAVG